MYIEQIQFGKKQKKSKRFLYQNISVSVILTKKYTRKETAILQNIHLQVLSERHLLCSMLNPKKSR